MTENIVGTYATLYMDTLLNDVIPFWEKHSLDEVHGGYFTCLDQEGKLYDMDKFMWPQGRQIWMFSKLYNEVEKKQRWLDIASKGVRFLDDHGQDGEGSYYFSFTRDGQPLTNAYNIYSDCFAALAYHEYAKASNDETAKQKALHAFHRFMDRRVNPKGDYEKTTGVRPLSNFGLTMMTAYLAFEMESIIGVEYAQTLYDHCIFEILERHYDKESGLIREFIHQDGGFLDTFEGRLINPGHGIEAIWFLMDIANKLDRQELIGQLVDICLVILKRSWDTQHDGIYYFMDVKGDPPQQLEHDQKLWWVHLEALIALSRAWLFTQRADVIMWYMKVHEYTWKHFPDPEYGEWFGYLNRQGEPHLTLKGGKWKCCFHLPRGLYECAKNFRMIALRKEDTQDNDS